MICTMPQCQTTAGCKCKTIESQPCWNCEEYHDLQRSWENIEIGLLRKIEALADTKHELQIALEASTQNLRTMWAIQTDAGDDDAADILDRNIRANDLTLSRSK